jgi:hypothetical protein
MRLNAYRIWELNPVVDYEVIRLFVNYIKVTRTQKLFEKILTIWVRHEIGKPIHWEEKEMHIDFETAISYTLNGNTKHHDCLTIVHDTMKLIKFHRDIFRHDMSVNEERAWIKLSDIWVEYYRQNYVGDDGLTDDLTPTTLRELSHYLKDNIEFWRKSFTRTQINEEWQL